MTAADQSGSAQHQATRFLLEHHCDQITDRFTGTASIPDAAMLRSFVAITAANELDVVAHSHAAADAHGAELLALVARARRWLPESVWWACLQGLAAPSWCVW
jgi:hypothetical protein